MAEPFLGEIRIFGGTFAPRGWALCDGRLMSIAQASALFSLLGTYYGGDGSSTFALPNLQGRFPTGVGTRAGGATYVQGQVGGNETVTLTVGNLAAHTHSFAPQESNANADQTDPTGCIPAIVNNADGRTPVQYPGYTQGASTGAMKGQVTDITGSNLPVPTIPPYLAITYIIALEGIYPSRP